MLNLFCSQQHEHDGPWRRTYAHATTTHVQTPSSKSRRSPGSDSYGSSNLRLTTAWWWSSSTSSWALDDKTRHPSWWSSPSSSTWNAPSFPYGNATTSRNGRPWNAWRNATSSHVPASSSRSPNAAQTTSSSFR